MTHNPILAELYAIREQLLADVGGDIQKYLAGVREREAASGRLLDQKGKTVSEPNSSRSRGCTGRADARRLTEVLDGSGTDDGV